MTSSRYLYSDGTNNLKEQGSAQDIYMANMIGEYLYNLGVTAQGRFGHAQSGISVGTSANTRFNEPVGTAPSTNISIATTTSTYSFSYDASSPAAAAEENNAHPVAYVNSGATVGIQEMTASAVDTALDRYLSYLFTNEGPGVYRVAAVGSTPTPGTWVGSGIDINHFIDTTTGGSTTVYRLWQKTDASGNRLSGESIKRPLKYSDASGNDDLIEMTDSEIKTFWGSRAVVKILASGAATGIGAIRITTSSSAPSLTGTWTLRSSYVDTRNTTADENYTRSYQSDYETIYTAEYENVFSDSYTTNYTADYTTVYSRVTGTIDYEGPKYNIEYVNEYEGSFTSDYNRNFVEDYVSTYTRDFESDYLQVYIRSQFVNYLKDYQTNYAVEYLTDYVSEYTTEYLKTFSDDYIRAVAYVGNQAYEGQGSYAGAFTVYTTAYTTEQTYTRSLFYTSSSGTLPAFYTSFWPETMIYLGPTQPNYIRGYTGPAVADYIGGPSGNTTYRADFFERAFESATARGENLVVYLDEDGPGTDALYAGGGNPNSMWSSFTGSGYTGTVPGTSFFQGSARPSGTRTVFFREAYMRAFPNFARYISQLPVDQSFETVVDYVNENVQFTRDYQVGFYQGPQNYVRENTPFLGDTTFTGFYQGEFETTYTSVYTEEYIGDYLNEYQTAYTMLDESDGYATAYVGTFEGSFNRFYSKEYESTFVSPPYTNAFQRNYIQIYTGTYTADFETDYENVFTANFSDSYTSAYTALYNTDYLTTYTTDYLTDFAGETIQASTGTINTYYMWVRTS